MNKAIQITGVLTEKYVENSAFDSIELTAKKFLESEMSDNLIVSSVVVSAGDLTADYLKIIADKMKAKSVKNLVISTEKMSYEGKAILKEIITQSVDNIKDIQVCIENGYDFDGIRYARNGLTSATELKRFVEELNEANGVRCFYVAINTGHANIFAMNVGQMITELGALVKVIHLNDNDGKYDMHQLPFTFTTGRGDLATNWYGIAKALYHTKYDGYVVFDVEGVFSSIPEAIVPQTLKVLYGIIEEWEYFADIENRLNQPDKEIILFGAGAMFENYMKLWGEKYPPSFLVDNNPATWGTERHGIKIKSPEEIRNVEPERRNVFICNMYYREIKAQLDNMGIEADRYDDRYM